MKTRDMPWTFTAEVLVNPLRDGADVLVFVVISGNNVRASLHMDTEILRGLDGPEHLIHRRPGAYVPVKSIVHALDIRAEHIDLSAKKRQCFVSHKTVADIHGVQAMVVGYFGDVQNIL